MQPNRVVVGAPSLSGLPYFTSSKTTIDVNTQRGSTELTVRFGEEVKLWHLGARYAIKSQEEEAASFRTQFRAQTQQDLNERHEAQQPKKHPGPHPPGSTLNTFQEQLVRALEIGVKGQSDPDACANARLLCRAALAWAHREAETHFEACQNQLKFGLW